MLSSRTRIRHGPKYLNSAIIGHVTYSYMYLTLLIWLTTDTHQQIKIEDVDSARRRFSDNRFKDLGDEYAENYPQISLVLSRFYGLGRRYTPGGMESFIRKLLRDPEVVRLCGSWIYEYQQMIQLVRLLYNIGFVGLQKARVGCTIPRAWSSRN